ncbi:diguanylate cyclase (GGDEF)-like protein [Nitrosospira sp. Nsp2]|uniref:diguanylate cyclase domain-containing protein n=1 Tax=Nitrosospira sp. Nsp2 TaxID=136548 RepID=UPI000D31629A|nr:diguanylate cyclase [Nitrosospira sp. Nsp2]PTR17219.1 diguanylate cyclase (GGDEF)-like protein [Nitrosospira sp. Nsp2]
MTKYSPLEPSRSTTPSNPKIDSENSSPVSASNTPFSLGKALEKNDYVKEKIEECATELSTINETMKKEISPIAASPQVKKALEQNKDVEEKIQESAVTLGELNDVLVEEMDDSRKLEQELKQTKQELSATRAFLSTMENVVTGASLAAEKATLRTMRDFVTGIPSRELFNDRLEQAVALATRHDWILAIMFIDLDRFKLINDTYGHATGDTVLQIVAQRLDEQVRSEDTVCRYGGDEFLYLLVNPKSPRNIQLVADRVCERISQPLIIGDLELTVGASIGIAVYPNDAGTPSELVANADAAMYRAKEKNGGYIFFDQDKDPQGSSSPTAE